MLTNKESSNLKDQLKEKEYNYQQMEEKYKKLENDYNELNKATEKVPEEIQKRDEAIEYYKNQLDQKEKIYNEELRIMSSLYHRLSFQCAKLRLVKETQTYNTLNI
jgi:CRISPR/Cas system CSM-associated protein Csm5 (group 7 of RAMP superfamily)